LHAAVLSLITAASCPAAILPHGDGFRGTWYIAAAIGLPYKYLYSGGFATYPQQMSPQAYYAAEVDKTFFAYGGTDADNSTLYHMLSYFDHATGQVARPRVLLDKRTINAHDNPTIMLDDAGYIYVFSNSQGSTGRSSYIHRSVQPYSIDEFEPTLSMPPRSKFSYSQPHYVAGQGLMFLHTQYDNRGRQRSTYFNTSSDGVNWDYDWDSQPSVAALPGGNYGVSETNGQIVGAAFNHLLDGAGPKRTNLYYVETADFGQTWRTIDGTALATPITNDSGPSLVHDYAAEGLRIGLKDLRYDAEGRPVILYATNVDMYPGPDGGPRVWHTARFDGSAWIINDVFESDHAYDHGSLSIEDDGLWRIIAPSEPGARPFMTGGDMAMWTSRDHGDSWQMTGVLTQDDDYSHTYARRPENAHDDFYAFWGAADPLAWMSESSLYFTDRTGTGVWELPWTMEEDFATPTLAFNPTRSLTSAAAGNWNQAAVWHPGEAAPAADDAVLVRHHAILVDADAEAFSLTLNGNGSLEIAGESTLTIANHVQVGAGTLHVSAAGTLSVEGNVLMDRSAAYACEIGAADGGLIAAAGDVHIGGTLALPVVAVGDPGLSSGTILTSAGPKGIVGTFTEIPQVHYLFTGDVGHLGMGVFFGGVDYVGAPGKVTQVTANLITAPGGDGNGDSLVDGQDIANLIANFSRPGDPPDRTWLENDTAGGPQGRGDGNVDGQDITNLIANFTGDPGPTDTGAVKPAVASAEYDPNTGEFRMSVSGVLSWHFESEGLFAADLQQIHQSLGGQKAMGGQTLISVNPNTVGEGSLLAPLEYADLTLGALIAPAPNRREMQSLIAGDEDAELRFVYITGWGAQPQYAPIRIVPEANVTAMLLGGLASLLFLWCWRVGRGCVKPAS